MRRTLCIGAGFLAILVLLGIGSMALNRRVQAVGVQDPAFEVDPLWPKPLPNHWIVGQTIGVSVDAQDHIWIIHRAGSLEAGREARHDKSADRAMLRSRAAGAGVRSGRQSDRALGRSGQGLRLARIESRDHRRLQGQRLDRRQWPAARTSGRGAVNGADEEPAAGGRGRGSGGFQRFNDNMILKFTQDGKFLMQIGKPGQSKGQQRRREPPETRQDCLSIRRPTSCMSPTATAIIA